MKKLLLQILLAFCSASIFAQGGISYDWAKKIGQSSGSGNESVRDMKVSNGFVYVIGGFQGIVDFDPGVGVTNLTASGNNDIFFAKYTIAGDYVWANKIGSTGDDFGLGIALGTNDTIVIVGYFQGAPNQVDFNPGPAVNSLASAGSSDGFIAKYDSAGRYQWVRRIAGTGEEYVWDVTFDSNENIFVTGNFSSTGVSFEDPVAPAQIISSSAPFDIYFAKYDRGGICQYANGFIGGATSNVGGNVIITDVNDDVYIAGYFVGTCDFDASANTANLSASVNSDVFLAKYTNAGAYTWVRAMGGTTTTSGRNDNAYSLNVTKSGNIIIGGEFWETGSFTGQTVTAQGLSLSGFFASYTPAGNCNWVKAITGGSTSNSAQVYKTDLDAAGNIYVTGRFTGTLDFDGSLATNYVASSPVTADDIYLAKYDSLGNFIWVNKMGGTTSDIGFALSVDDSSRLYLGGYFSGTADFDAQAGVQNLIATSGNDAFIARYSQCDLPLAPSSIIGLDSTCSSLFNEVYTATPVPGATSYTWSLPPGWSGTSTTNTIAVSSNLASGTISVRANTSCGASLPTSFPVYIEVANVTAFTSVQGNTTVCTGGVGTFTASGGTSGPSVYVVWQIPAGATIIGPSNGATITVQFGNTIGSVQVRAARARFCATTAFTTATVNVQAEVNGSVGPINPSVCSGSSVTLTASGGNTYAWSNGLGSGAAKTVSPTTATTYTVTITQTGNVCPDVDTITVTVNSLPTAVIAPATVAICIGQSTTLTASGGTQYAWSNSGGSNAAATFSPTANTTYTVTVTNAASCSATATRLVTVNANPTAAIAPATVAICNGQSTTLTASGGTQYAWSNSGGSNAAATFSPTTNTTYTVTVTNASSCSATASRLVTVNANPTAAITPATVAICNGQSTTLTASGGTQYAWSNSGGSNAAATFSPTANTTYTVTVTNAASCSATASRLVTVNANPTAAIAPATVAICNGQSTTLTASGGTQYAWSNSGGSNAAATFSPTANTTYTVTVTNAAGCSATASRLVTVNANPTASINGPTTICSGLQATLTASGGGTYVWSGGLGSNAAINVSPTSNTTYTVTVTGTGNCTATASQTVTVQTSPTATISGADSICTGNSVTLTANGGNTYIWSGGLGSTSSITISPTTTTTYTVTVSIGANCSATSSKTVIVNQNPTAGVTPASATICSGQSQTFTASGSGAYTWSNSGGSLAAATFSPNINTTYTVTVTNAASCTATASGSVVVNQTPTASITPATVTICNGESATLTAAGGGTYTWSNGGGSTAAATFSPTTTTTYTVTVSNANNCTATATRSVTVNAVPTAATNPATASICNGQSQTLTASGGGTYAWSNSLGAGATKSVTPSATTTYTVTVTSANNCTATTTSTVSVTTVTAVINGPSTICSGLSATLTASGGGTYAWSNSQSTAAITISPVVATTYTVTVTNNNCTATASQTVSVQSAPTAVINGNSSVCAGSSITLTANGGNTYSWANGLGTNAAITVSPTQTTTYTVTASLGAGCTATATKTVTVNQPTANTLNQTICQGTSYSFKGQNLSTAGTYRDTTQTAQGCDSITVLSLVVTPAIQRQISQTICFGASFSFKGQTLTQAGTYRDTTSTAQGCDSITTLTLIVRNRAQSIQNVQLCTGQSYSFKGQSLTQAGQYLDTVQTTAGCDSFITLNLSVNSFVTGTTTKAICQGESFTFNGQSLTQAGQYIDTLTSAGGCDSILTLTLTINSLPTPTVTKTGANLSTQTFASYQWKLNGTNITGATGQNYTATQNGSYTVEVMDANGCKNTSAAVQVTGLSIENTINDLKVSIYPNPANELLNIEVEAKEFSLTITDIAGRKMMVETNQKAISLSTLASGVYNIEIKTESGIVRKQFIKE